MDNLIKGRERIVEYAIQHPKDVYINGPADERKVSITFDDGPDPYVTPRILDILRNNKVKASFFCVGSQISYFPNIIRKAYDDGHLILNHSWNHPYFTNLDPDSIKKQVTTTERKIESIIGRRSAIVRPPYGAINDMAFKALNETNNKIAIWSIDTMDWVPNIDTQTIIGNVLNNVRPGDIIIMHSSRGHSANIHALPEIIIGLKRRNFKIVDLGTLLGINPYK
jgi:peptidoglycan/xylan/chitin deacetylase (PgdA/CDA1 family)